MLGFEQRIPAGMVVEDEVEQKADGEENEDEQFDIPNPNMATAQVLYRCHCQVSGECPIRYLPVNLSCAETRAALLPAALSFLRR